MKQKRSTFSFARISPRWPDAPALLAWLLPVFAWAPLAYPGYPELHNGFLPVFNLVDFWTHWGEWGWMPLIGRPFDLWRGEGSLPYALAALFQLAGMAPGGAIKLTLAAGLVAGSAGMYRWARSRLGPWPALIAALAYVYWPMGLAQVLVRGALAEVVLLGLLPWVLQAAESLCSDGFSRPSPRGARVSPGDEDGEMAQAALGATADENGRTSQLAAVRRTGASPGVRVFKSDAHAALGATADENAAEHPERSEAQSKGAERSSGQGRILRLRATALRSGCSRIFGADAHAAGGATADEKAHRTRAFRRFLRLHGQPAKASSPDRRTVIFRAVLTPKREDLFRAVALALGMTAVLWTQAGLGLWLAGLLLGWWLGGQLVPRLSLRLGLRLKSQAGTAKPVETGSGGPQLKSQAGTAKPIEIGSGEPRLKSQADTTKPVETGSGEPRLKSQAGTAKPVETGSGGPRLKSQAGTAKPAEAGSGGGGPRMFLVGWVGGVILGLLGLLPAVLRHGWSNATYVAFGDHFVYPHQLLWAGWGRGPSIPGPDDTLSFSLGLVAFGLVMIALVWPQRSDVTGESKTQNGSLGYLLPVLFLAFMASSLAAAVWGPLPLAARMLTYPWQLLLLVGPWWAYVAGMGAQKLMAALPQRLGPGWAIPINAALVVLTVLSVYSNLRVEPAGSQPPVAPIAIYGRDEIVLLRTAAAGAPGPGGKVSVAVEWQALRPLDRDYTVFFHVLGPDGMRYGQQDTMPVGGRLPTSRWRPGQVVADEYSATLASDAPVGEGYRYWLGFYDLATGERLAVGTDDKVVLEPGEK